MVELFRKVFPLPVPSSSLENPSKSLSALPTVPFRGLLKAFENLLENLLCERVFGVYGFPEESTAFAERPVTFRYESRTRAAMLGAQEQMIAQLHSRTE